MQRRVIEAGGFITSAWQQAAAARERGLEGGSLRVGGVY